MSFSTTARRAALLAAAAAAAALAAPSGAAAAPNLTPSGTLGASSTLARYPLAAVGDGLRQVDFDYWNDGSQGTYGDWVGVSWGSARTVGRVTLRMPVLRNLTLGQRTIGRLTLEYLDGGSWRAVATTNGQPNPVVNWVTPRSADGSQIKQFYFAPVTTTAVRVRYDGGNSDGWVFLEELETYATSQLQDYEETLSYLRGQALRVVNGSRLTGTGGTTIFAPDGVAHYQGQWTRDWEYALEGYPEAMSIAEMQRAFDYQIARQRADGQIPTLVTTAGAPIWGPHGDDTDNAQFLVKAAWEIWRASGSTAHFSGHAAALARAMNGVPRNAATGLVWIDPAAPHSSYGFTDSIVKTGDELFCSLLYVEAARKLADLYAAAGNATAAATWTGNAARVEAGLATLWNSSTGLFDATSIAPRPDVWGSAYAVVLGLATPAQEASIAAWLAANHDQVVQNGQLRHLPGGVYWNAIFDSLALPDRYQNGGYWATASGWAAYALAKNGELTKARQLIIDMARYFREVGFYEASNAHIGYVAVAEYVASVTAPLSALRKLDGPNLALAGTASSSSLHPSGTFAVAALNNGRRDGVVNYWNDGTQGAHPDWAKVEWRTARTIAKVVVRMPVVPFLTAPARTIGSVTVQHWDGSAWVALRALNGEPNPVVSWTAPAVHDGRAIKTFAIAPVSTTAIRVLYDAGNADGWSFLEELEAYGG